MEFSMGIWQFLSDSSPHVRGFLYELFCQKSKNSRHGLTFPSLKNNWSKGSTRAGLTCALFDSRIGSLHIERAFGCGAGSSTFWTKSTRAFPEKDNERNKSLRYYLSHKSHSVLPFDRAETGCEYANSCTFEPQ